MTPRYERGTTFSGADQRRCRDQGRLTSLLLATVILAPATLLYVKARSERGRRVFSATEIGLCAVIVAAGITGIVGLSTGFIAI
jgi:arginine:ornithine antiporter / lysine permease